MKTFFLLLRITTGLMAIGGILLVLAIVFLRSLPGFAKHIASIIGYLAVAFTSAFTKGTEPKDPGWVVGLPQVALALLFAAMVVSAFLPGSKIFLHVLAAFVTLLILWYVWMAMTENTAAGNLLSASRRRLARILRILHFLVLAPAGTDYHRILKF